MKGFSYKTSAIALQSRRLVSISKRHGIWRAAVTDAGAYYLVNGNYPTSGLSVRPNKNTDHESSGSGTQSTIRRSRHSPTPSSSGRVPPARKIPAAPKSLSPTEQLIADLLANDGEVRVGRPDSRKYEARVSAAIRFGKVPEGKQLAAEGSRWSSEYVVRLQDAPAWLNAVLDPVLVPATLRNLHPVVAALQERGLLRGVDRSGKKRALLVVQALAVEASRRGHTVKATEASGDRYGYGYRRPESKDDFSIAAGGLAVGIELRQSVDHLPHEATKAELQRAERDSWFSIPKFDSRPGDRLSIQLSSPHEHRQSKWSDSAARRIEDCLAQVLQEVELRCARAEQVRLAAIEEAAVRRREWERATEQAKVDYREACLARELDRQVNDWLRAGRLHSYLAAMELVIDGMEPSQTDEAMEWFKWATRHVSAIDPLQGRIQMPNVSEPRADDLAPFLHGWNPYGP
jgi:hypothetical protein